MYDVRVDKQINLDIQPGKVVEDIDLLPFDLSEWLKVDLFEKYGKKNASSSSKTNQSSSSSTITQCIKMTKINVNRSFHDKSSSSSYMKENIYHKDEITTVPQILPSPPQQFLLKQPPLIPPSITISKYNYSLLSQQSFSGSYYTYMMVHFLKNKKKDTNIGVTKNPFYSVYLHNGLHIVNKNTSSAAPHWELYIVMGPFKDEETALACAREWVSQTRGCKSKENRANELYMKYAVNLYTRKMMLNQPFDEFLIDSNASIHHINHAQKIMYRTK